MDADRSVMWPVEMFFVSGFLTITNPREIAMYIKGFAELAECAVYGARAKDRIVAAIEALD